MNKKGFIEKLVKKTGYSTASCTLICEILEDSFFLSSKKKEEIVSRIMSELSLSLVEATSIYEVSISIIHDEIRGKLKHPFGK